MFNINTNIPIIIINLNCPNTPVKSWIIRLDKKEKKVIPNYMLTVRDLL